MALNETLSAVETAKSELVGEFAQRFGEVRLSVAGCSMLPSLRPGDVVQISRCNVEDLRPGEIVQIILEGRLVTHRLVGRDGDLFVTQGDAVAQPDPPVSAAQIIGRVTSVVRDGRRVDPSLTFFRQLGAKILRRSGFSARVLWRLRRHAWEG
jgi:signal peptidase I